MSRNVYRSQEALDLEGGHMRAKELGRRIDRINSKPLVYRCQACGDERGPHIVHGFLTVGNGGCGDLSRCDVFCTRCDIWWQGLLANAIGSG